MNRPVTEPDSPANVIDGKRFAAELRARIADRVTTLRHQHRVVPGLTVVLVGENPASEVYVRNKEKQAREAGMSSIARRLPAATTESELLALIDELNRDSAVHGILVQ